MKNRIVIVLISALVSSISHASHLQDFCIADRRRPDSPSGYHCLPSDTVTAEDFKFSFGQRIPVPTKTVLYPASLNEFPALNGLGISAGLVEMEIGGSLPVHLHAADEILIISQGEMTVGTLTPTRAYVNTLKPGDLVVFPKGLLHYLLNSGKEKALAYAFYNNPNPRLHFVHRMLFGNNVSTYTMSQVTFLDEPQVKKLKVRFNGTG